MWNENRSNTAVAGVRTPLESPLVGAQNLLDSNQALQSKAFRLRERPFLDLANVRGDARDREFIAAVEGAIGVRLPTKPNTVARGAEYDALWLGPDEWLIRSTEARKPELEGKLRTALGTLFASAVESLPSVRESPKVTTVPSASPVRTSSAVRYRQRSTRSVNAVPVVSPVRSPSPEYDVCRAQGW